MRTKKQEEIIVKEEINMEEKPEMIQIKNIVGVERDGIFYFCTARYPEAIKESGIKYESNVYCLSRRKWFELRKTDEIYLFDKVAKDFKGTFLIWHKEGLIETRVPNEKEISKDDLLVEEGRLNSYISIIKSAKERTL